MHNLKDLNNNVYALYIIDVLNVVVLVLTNFNIIILKKIRIANLPKYN